MITRPINQHPKILIKDYHTLQRFLGFNLLSFGQLQAFANSSMFDKTPFTLKNQAINQPINQSTCLLFVNQSVGQGTNQRTWKSRLAKVKFCFRLDSCKQVLACTSLPAKLHPHLRISTNLYIGNACVSTFALLKVCVGLNLLHHIWK